MPLQPLAYLVAYLDKLVVVIRCFWSYQILCTVCRVTYKLGSTPWFHLMILLHKLWYSDYGITTLKSSHWQWPGVKPRSYEWLSVPRLDGKLPKSGGTLHSPVSSISLVYTQWQLKINTLGNQTLDSLITIVERGSITTTGLFSGISRQTSSCNRMFVNLLDCMYCAQGHIQIGDNSKVHLLVLLHKLWYIVTIGLPLGRAHIDHNRELNPGLMGGSQSRE